MQCRTKKDTSGTGKRGGVGMQTVYETERLFLEVLTEQYVNEVQRFYEDGKEIFEQYELDRIPNFYTRNYQELLLRCEYKMMERGQALRLWVFEKGNKEKIAGTFSFHNIRYSGYQSCELGYKFAQEYWGKGYARESISKGIEIIFREWGIHRIEALVSMENNASRNLLEYLGFGYEGIRRHAVKLRGEWQDHEVYSLLNQ